MDYSPEALEAQLHGDVSLLVVVDVRGKVVRAELEQGDPVFEQVALEAARRLVFEPAYKDGSPVQVSTRVYFHFAPPVDFDDTPGLEIVVHADHPDRSDTRARTTLDEEDLEERAGEDLAATVTEVPGVRMAGGGTDAAKPIIRGHHERRLLVLNDGVRHESQKWGPDHAPEIDPFSAGSISVIRGAAGTRYGPDAIGGVILVEPPPLRSEAGVQGKLLTAYNSNGRRPYSAFRVDTRVQGRAFYSNRGQCGGRREACQHPTTCSATPASRVWNLGGAVAKEWDGGRLTATFHHHDFLAGIFYGVVNATPDEFFGQLERDRPISADLWETSYEIDRPYQAVTHDVGTVKTEWAGDWGSFEAIYAFQINLREEFEQVRDDITGPQFDFTLRTHSVDTFYQHPEVALSWGELEGGVGLQGTFQENVYRGLPLIPNFRGFSGGVFAYERLLLNRVDLEAGARVDGLSRAAYLRDSDYENHVRRDTLDESACESLSSGERYRCPADYLAGSFSLGALAHVVPEHFDLKLDFSTATRFPNVDELYLLGHAQSFPVYANGFPDLGTETVWNGSLTGGVRLDWLEAEVSGYAQVIEDYIYFSPVINDSGTPKVETTIRGAYPGWDFRPIDARFAGVDGALSLGPEAPLGLQVIGGLVRGQDEATGKELVGTPADYLSIEFVGRAPSLGWVSELEAEICLGFVAAQSRVDPLLDFAPPPPGYALWGAGLSAEVGHKRPLRIGVDAHNLLNTRYRDYNSLIRYYADQPGRDIRVRAGMDF